MKNIMILLILASTVSFGNGYSKEANKKLQKVAKEVINEKDWYGKFLSNVPKEGVK